MSDSPQLSNLSSTADQSSSASIAPDRTRVDWSYEATVKRIEEIMARIEAGQLDLADVFDEFAAAVEYLQQCEAFLAQRQRQVNLLIETLTDESDF